MKANGILPGTNTFPDNDGYVLAARRGLIISSHHYNILGLSPVMQGGPQWYPEVFDYQKRPDAMIYAWNASATVFSTYPEVFYTVGLRGPGDEPATCDGHCTLRDKAEHVSWAIGNQTGIVEKVVENPKYYAWLWAEGLSYLEAGYLKIPDNATVIFTDGGDGEVKGLEYAKNGAGICTSVGAKEKMS
jgi:hypothetical protein